jgi:hypothetical protein
MSLFIDTCSNNDGNIIKGKDYKNLIDSKEISKHQYQGLIHQPTIFLKKMSEEEILKLSKIHYEGKVAH